MNLRDTMRIIVQALEYAKANGQTMTVYDHKHGKVNALEVARTTLAGLEYPEE